MKWICKCREMWIYKIKSKIFQIECRIESCVHHLQMKIKNQERSSSPTKFCIQIQTYLCPGHYLYLLYRGFFCFVEGNWMNDLQPLKRGQKLIVMRIFLNLYLSPSRFSLRRPVISFFASLEHVNYALNVALCYIASSTFQSKKKKKKQNTIIIQNCALHF